MDILRRPVLHPRNQIPRARKADRVRLNPVRHSLPVQKRSGRAAAPWNSVGGVNPALRGATRLFIRSDRIRLKGDPSEWPGANAFREN